MKTSFLQRFWVTFSCHVVGFYAAVLNKLTVKGSHHIPESGGVLFTSNHISSYETIFLPWAVIRSHPLQMLWAPAKEELFEKTFQRIIYTSWGAFPVKRKRDAKASIVIENLLTTEKVMLFPEGTRNRDGRLSKGNRGVGKIIYETHPVVIPTALIGLNQWKFPGFGQPATIVFGAPLDFSDLYLRENNKETHQLITERVMQAIAGLLKNEGAYVE